MKSNFTSYSLVKLALPLFWLVFAMEARSQDVRTATATWLASNATDKKSALSFNNDSKFVTGDSEITWIQKGGKKIYRFSIVKVSGVWPDVKTDGSITWDVLLNNKKGVITIGRQNGQTQLKLKYRSGESTALDLEYVIQTVETK